MTLLTGCRFIMTAQKQHIMRKQVLIFVLVIATFGMFAFTVDFKAENDFSFPEYVETLNTAVLDGCHASCGTTSCSGSGDCVCSCDTFNCDCKPNPDPKPIGYKQQDQKQPH